jgi:hypothetical protein
MSANPPPPVKTHLWFPEASSRATNASSDPKEVTFVVPNVAVLLNRPAMLICPWSFTSKAWR